MAEAPNIAGALIPGSLAVLYHFPHQLLVDAVRYIFGDEAAIATTEGHAAHDWTVAPGVRFDTEEGYFHLRIVLSWLHEQLHVRHLTSSPVGFGLWVLQAQEYALSLRGLRRWGQRVGAAGLPARQPVFTRHGDDAEVQEIATTKRNFSVFHQTLRRKVDLSGEDLAATVLPALLATLKPFCERVLGQPSSIPQFVSGLPGAGSAPLDALSGDAVVEGLARVNEYLAAMRLGAGVEVLNRYSVEKGLELYQGAIGLVGRFLKVEPPKSWLIAARLLDWALQAPLLPFLLAGRGRVGVEEMLPGWRFTLLVFSFQRLGFTLDDLLARGDDVQRALFQARGWESPLELADRIRTANLKLPEPLLTRACVEKLRLAAELRLRDPAVLFAPVGSNDTLRLEKGFSLFEDGAVASSGGLTPKELVEFSLGLLDDAVVDAVWASDTLSAPFSVAGQLSRALFGGALTPLALVARTLNATVGVAAGKEIMMAFAESGKE